jgi:hypothetical protein
MLKDEAKIYTITGEFWSSTPMNRKIKAFSLEEAKVLFITQVADDFGLPEDKVRQFLYIHKGSDANLNLWG